MKKIFTITFFVILCNLASYSQNFLNSIYFTDINTGYAVGSMGTIQKTTDAGNIWKALTTKTIQNFNAIYFTNANTGYIVGTCGTILKTTDAGTTWFF